MPRKQRRRSWFQNSVFFSLFASAPPSPVHEVTCQKQRSHSLDPDVGTHHKPTRSPTLNLNLGKSTIQSFLSKAKRSNTKRSPTQINDPSPIVLDEPADYFSINTSDPTQTAATIGGDGARRYNPQLILTDNVLASVHPLQPQPPPAHKYHHHKHASEPNHFLKSDDDEVDRIQLKNDLVKLAFEGEFKFPFRFQDLKNGRILDVGCGPGSWCIDIARKYPSVQVIGVDSEDMFPDPVTVPTNCQLVRYNVLDGLSAFEDNTLDFIHIRFMALSFTVDQYTKVIKDCWRILRPGGYLEMMEADITIYSPGPVTAKFNKEGNLKFINIYIYIYI
ncbi:S-adenosyl-L-methionine-dependent methyltransferase [Phycomyces blakesleeanus]